MGWASRLRKAKRVEIQITQEEVNERASEVAKTLSEGGVSADDLTFMALLTMGVAYLKRTGTSEHDAIDVVKAIHGAVAGPETIGYHHVVEESEEAPATGETEIV